MKIEQWTGCYRGSRGDLFTQESTKHPAKMSVGLCYRIFEHGRARGYWEPGDVILDPMAGIGTTLVVGATLGYRVLGIELKSHFIELAWDNILGCAQRVPGSGKNFVATGRVPPFGIVQGDARRLSEILNLKSQMAGAVTSPPYAGDAPARAGADHNERCDEKFGGEGKHQKLGRSLTGRGYSGVVTSPPYADSPGTPSLGSVNKDNWGKEGKDIVGRRGLGRGYSGAISSPPYADNEAMHPNQQFRAPHDSTGKLAATGSYAGAIQNLKSKIQNGQIGNLRDPRNDIDAVLSSPPYGDVMSTAEARGKPSSGWIEDKGIPHNKYGNEEAQIGNKNAETYLSAMLAVYRELHAVLKAGGVVCLVTKNPVKAGKIRRLDDDTIRLMEAAGFELIERVQALLAEDLGEQMTLDGGSVKIRRERKSFFKRLFERKRPDLKVDHEDVLFFRSTP